MMTERLTAEIESTREQSRLKKLTRKAAMQFGRQHGWTLTNRPFTLEELAGQSRERVSAQGKYSKRIFDHPSFYRDYQGRPAAIVVHLYDWPEIGPDVEVACEQM